MYVEGQEKLVTAGGVIITGKELASIRCPALIMHGKRDRIVPVDYAHMISERIPNAHMLLFDAGHAAHLRCEKQYTPAIIGFSWISKVARGVHFLQNYTVLTFQSINPCWLRCTRRK
jgi:pimeloyl-ACP methyl ester carboxylesterase